MPLSPEMLKRLERVGETVRQVCEREGVHFVLVIEPREEPTGCFVLADSDGPNAIRETRQLLEAAINRLAHGHYNAVKL